jgi:poly(beta-D-mannuronate) lyase
MKRLAAVFAFGLPSVGFAASCEGFADPVLDLAFASRYVAEDASRSQIDPQKAAEAEAALAPLDDFVSDMTRRTDAAMAGKDSATLGCIMGELAHWAQADALSDLGTQTVQLTIGSRLAALATVAQQVLPAGDAEAQALVRDWLGRRIDAQMTFWETAPKGAARGNLRAWAALAAAATAQITKDPVQSGWAAWSVTYVACSANPDGSLPQEMRRGKLALHYQLHAVAPLTVAAAHLEAQGIAVLPKCGDALQRIVDFTLADVAAGGAASAALSGEAQTVQGGLVALKDFQLAWAEAWLRLRDTPQLEEAVADRRPLKYSKLGGDQSRLWAQTD